jgi:hypothetical protein
MATPQRPAFYEGQILAATDLAGTVDHARGRAARHDRYLHEWGIAEGLELTAEPVTDPATGARYVEVTLQPGLVVDGTGRDVVVPEPVAISEALFQEVNGADAPSDDPYPVFLAGLDRDPPPGSSAADACGATARPGRVDESYQIIFGRLGDERLVAEQRPPEVSDRPGDGRVPWLVLLGYVRSRDGRFTAVDPEARGVRPRFAGVRADTVAARGGALALRSRPAADEGGPVVTLGGAGLSFGLYKADGSVEPLMAVSPRGDLSVRGTISGGQAGAGVTAASGVISDGMIVPLPTGVPADQVADGRIVLHVSVTPFLADAPAEWDGVWLAGPVECAVDAERRVRCRARWLRADGGTGELRDRPAAANFMVVATAAPDPDASGGGS